MGGCLCGTNRKPGRILLLGIPESGKTTALYRLKIGEVVKTVPTHGYNMENIKIGRRLRDVWDVGSCIEDRDDFLFCLNDVSAVVFVVDCSADEKKLVLAINKLELMLAETELEKCPVAVAANKQDLETNITVNDIQKILKEKECMKYRYWKVFPTSSLAEDGILGLNIMMKWVDSHDGKEKKRPEQKQQAKRRRKRRQVTHRSFREQAGRRDELHYMANKFSVIGINNKSYKGVL